jgi:hypothetical protein
LFKEEKMKKLSMLLAIVMLLVVAIPTLAKNPKSPADHNGLNKGKSEMQHLYLYEKDSADWSVIEDGAWGKMTFNTDRFVFNGHGLEAETSYSLIKYNGTDWPEAHCIATGMSGSDGNIHLSGDEMDPYGDKIWLVLDSNVNCDLEKMTGWNPTEYLFEYDGFTE